MDDVDREKLRQDVLAEGQLAAARRAANASDDVAKELRALRRMLKSRLTEMVAAVDVIADRLTELPELLEEQTRETARVADQLEKLRLRAAEKV